MSVNNPERTYTSEEFDQRAANILDGKCEDCPLFIRLMGRSAIHDGIIYDKVSTLERLGGFIGGTMQAIKPDACNGQRCLTPNQREELEASLLIDFGEPYEETASERFIAMALERRILTERELNPEPNYADW